jgi:HlyD family secretion protein
MNTIRKIRTHFAKRPFIYGALVVIIIIVVGYTLFGNSTVPEQTLTVTRSEFLNQISVSGKVVASQSAELGFDQSGRISAIYKKVGDAVTAGTIIASIDNATLRAEIAQKQAALDKENAKLVSLQKGTRPEELAISEQSYVDATRSLMIAMNNAYIKTENSLLNEADILFENGNSVNPTLVILDPSDTKTKKINADRLAVTLKMNAWKQAIESRPTILTKNTVDMLQSISIETMQQAQTLLSTLNTEIIDLGIGSSGLTQTEIDTYRTTINTASQNVSATLSAEQTAYATWTSAYRSYALDKSGSTPEDIAAQSAAVKSAEADLLSARAQLAKSMVTAPFDGIITKLDIKIGEIVSPNTPEITLMTTGAFEIESYIPEINIAYIKLGDMADISLDAYGENVVFKASITAIDPAETVRDGVSTYKTRLRFSESDPRIKSGMTANIKVTTEKKSDVIVIPHSIITEKDGNSYVTLRVGDIHSQVLVTKGSVSVLGQVEITSGLNEGDIVVLPALTKP